MVTRRDSDHWTAPHARQHTWTDNINRWRGPPGHESAERRDSFQSRPGPAHCQPDSRTILRPDPHSRKLSQTLAILLRSPAITSCLLGRLSGDAGWSAWLWSPPGTGSWVKLDMDVTRHAMAGRPGDKWRWFFGLRHWDAAQTGAGNWDRQESTESTESSN